VAAALGARARSVRDERGASIDSIKSACVENAAVRFGQRVGEPHDARRIAAVGEAERVSSSWIASVARLASDTCEPLPMRAIAITGFIVSRSRCSARAPVGVDPSTLAP
jgi:hypothetical protein